MKTNEDAPKVSVCIITYNHEMYIRECLDSVFSQKADFEFEVIVGDDCSSDRTRDVLREYSVSYPDKLIVILQSQNIGGGCNNYRVVNATARGQYIANLDGDDIMEPNKLQLQSDFLDEHPDCSMVVHQNYILDSTGDKKKARTRWPRSKIVGVDYLLENNCFFVNSSKMCRASAIKKSAVLKQDFFIDFELHVEAACWGGVGIIDSPLLIYRKTPNSISRRAPENTYRLILATLRGFDHALRSGQETSLVLKEKSKYIYKSAVYFLYLGRSDLAGECFRIFDLIPFKYRAKFYNLLLLGYCRRCRLFIANILAIIHYRYRLEI